MADVVDRDTRSRMMSGIRGKDTRPELAIRKRLHALGFRYKLHDSSLPGKPDMVLPKYRAVILVNGCFWHGHHCHLFKWPNSRKEFWREKITRTIERDARNLTVLQDNGWRVLVIWECSLKGKRKLEVDEVVERTARWLKSGNDYLEITGTSAENDVNKNVKFKGV